MSEEVVKPIAEGSKNPVAKKPMSEQDFLASRIAKHAERAAPKAAKPPEPEPEPKKAEAKAETSTEGTQEEAKPTKAVLSKDVDELTDEEIAELAEKGKSGLLRRVAELTAKRKLAEEKLAQAEAAMRQQPAQLPTPKVENNPFAAVAKPEELAEKDKTYRDIVKWAERVLDEAEGAMPDDVVTNEGGNQYTKRQLKQVLRNAREARDEYIPARLRELQEENQRTQVEQALSQKARQELNWMEDESSETRKRYKVMTDNPIFDKIKKAVPEASPHLNYLFAHAANSIYGRKEIGIETTPRKPSPTTLTPPSSPTTSAAAPERKESREEVGLRELESRWKQSRKTGDFVALRAKQLATRKPIKLA